MSNDFKICPGCLAKLPDRNLPPADRYNASGECLGLYSALAEFTLTHGGEAFIHQHCVDAYGAQHAGGVSKNITTAFALIGLCLAVEYDYTGRQVQHVHTNTPKQEWPLLIPPAIPAPVNIEYVLGAADNHEREARIGEWSKAVWASWHERHNYIRGVIKDLV